LNWGFVAVFGLLNVSAAMLTAGLHFSNLNLIAIRVACVKHLIAEEALNTRLLDESLGVYITRGMGLHFLRVLVFDRAGRGWVITAVAGFTGLLIWAKSLLPEHINIFVVMSRKVRVFEVLGTKRERVAEVVL
jgi:hypothetical protein